MKRDLLQRGIAAGASLALVGLVLIAVPSALEAQPPPDVVLASVSAYQGGLGIRPEVSFKRAIVTISGAGQTFSRTVDGGGYFSIDTFDLEGKPLPDGAYSWQVQLLPDEATARELRIATTLNGGETPAPWEALSGTFSIRLGTIAGPELREAEPVRLEQPAFGMGVDLASGQQSLGRAAAGDSDQAVAAGAVEMAGVSPAESSGAAVALGAIVLGGDRPNGEDSDAVVGAGAASERAQTLSWNIDEQSEGSLRALALRQVKPADGSNGREPGSTPDN